MKIVGLITEYNPFHNGHLYHIEKALEVTGADTAIVVMSGNYVQRGAPAIMPKHLRAEVALMPAEAPNILPKERFPCWNSLDASTVSALEVNAATTIFWKRSPILLRMSRRNTVPFFRRI